MKYYIQNTRLRKKVEILTSLIPSLIFCLKYLPFRQAVKLPILVRKIKLVQFKGFVTIDSPKIKFGMIRIGFLDSRLWPDTGIVWCVNGNIIFKGNAKIGANSSIFVRQNAQLTFGSDFENTANLKIMCCCDIVFGKSVSLGWDTIIMDSSLHPLKQVDTNRNKQAYGPIRIGDYNWFGLQCLIMHSVNTPPRCIFGARSVVTRGGDYHPYCVHGGSPIRVLSTNVMRDFGNDRITDYPIQNIEC